MKGVKKRADSDITAQNYSRRDFLLGGGAVITADLLSSPGPEKAAQTTKASQPQKTSYAPSQGYIVYDSRKCAGCVTCMLACSLVHEGTENLSLARIQIAQSSFAKFPDDIKMAVCRQCVTPVCVQNCPISACFVDSVNGNVRRIASSRCIGCKTCLSACPQQPNRTVWNPGANKSTKCDLCAEAPYWIERGGPAGRQACVESCPMKALKLIHATPDQTETDGYDVNLRNENWLNLGLVDNMSIVPPSYAKAAATTPSKTGQKP
jgi:protein NrfC